jgi:serine/threonine protein kinase
MLTIPRRVPVAASTSQASSAMPTSPSGDELGAGRAGAYLPVALAAASASAILYSLSRLYIRRNPRPSTAGETIPSNDTTAAHKKRSPKDHSQTVPSLVMGPASPLKDRTNKGKSNMRRKGSPTDHAPARFEKLKEIGKGAFGTVYIGRNTKTGELIAIKEMAVEDCAELEVEYRLLEGVGGHPNVVEVIGYEVGKRHARLFLEWVAGGSLADILKMRRISEEGLLANYIRQILTGLQFLHESNLLHRDIKPRNILVTHKGELKLTDFGLSRHLASIGQQTRCCGTPVYMSPECMDGRFSVGSDIWAVGATMSEMITGRLPWSHIDPVIFNNQMALMLHIAKYKGDINHHPVVPPAGTVSDECRSFMLKCFAPNAEDRGTCAELLSHPFLLPSHTTTMVSSSSPPVFEGESCGTPSLGMDVGTRQSTFDASDTSSTETE